MQFIEMIFWKKIPENILYTPLTIASSNMAVTGTHLWFKMKSHPLQYGDYRVTYLFYLHFLTLHKCFKVTVIYSAP